MIQPSKSANVVYIDLDLTRFEAELKFHRCFPIEKLLHPIEYIEMGKTLQACLFLLHREKKRRSSKELGWEKCFLQRNF